MANPTADESAKVVDYGVSLAKMIVREHPHVCVGMNSSPTLILMLAALGLRKKTKVIQSERSFPGAVPLSLTWRLIRRITTPRVAKLVCQTERSAQWYVSRNLVRARNVAIIPNEFATPDFRSLGCPMDLPDLRGVTVISCVGRLAPEKGFDQALQIMARVVHGNRNVRLLLIGDGPELGRLRKLSEDLRIQEHVHFLPPIMPLSPLWKVVDIFLLTSRFEGIPNVLGEAMAHGKPCVAFDCPTGPSELIFDGQNGFLVPMGNCELAAEYCLRLINDPAAREQIGAQAKQVADRFSAAKIIALWSDVIQEVASDAETHRSFEAGRDTHRRIGQRPFQVRTNVRQSHGPRVDQR